jgi:hypothetical protein
MSSPSGRPPRSAQKQPLVSGQDLLDDGPEGRKLQGVYFKGQCFHAAKMAVWWAMFGPLMEATSPGEVGVIGYARLAFNAALVTLSPYAGALAARLPLRRTLVSTTVIRAIVWGFLVPLTWALLYEGQISAQTALYAQLGLQFLDGMQVALGNCVDIDCGGMDALSRNYGLALNDGLRNRFNAMWQMVFDMSFIVVNPMVAFAIALVGNQVDSVNGGYLLVGVATVFALLSVASVVCYCRLPRNNRVEEDGAIRLGMICSDVCSGFRIVFSSVPLLARLTFLGLETALEDALVAVVLPQLVLHSDLFLSNSTSTWGNVVVVGIVAIGKIGGVLASLWVKGWEPPETRGRGWMWLFVCVFLSCSFIVLLPLSVQLLSSAPTVAPVLPFVASLGFLFFSTGPKIGFQTLLQNMVAAEQAPQVFGFVAFAVTAMDGLVILVISSIFAVQCPDKSGEQCAHENLLVALWIVAGIYVAHGILEILVGPCLILNS